MDDFQLGSTIPPVLHPDAELRAADAQRPMPYRNATDRMARSVSKVALAVIVAFLALAWLLRALDIGV